MKNSASKLTLALSAFAVSFLFAAPMMHAEEAKSEAPMADKKADRKAKHDAEILKKYDTNGNGVLDPDEQAAKKADEDKTKAERAEKKKAHAAKEKAAEPK